MRRNAQRYDGPALTGETEAERIELKERELAILNERFAKSRDMHEKSTRQTDAGGGWGNAAFPVRILA